MSLEFREQFQCNRTFKHGGCFIDHSHAFHADSHHWNIHVEIGSGLKMTLTYNGNSSGVEQAVETFGRIYIVDDEDSATDHFYSIPRTQFNLINNNYVVEQKEVDKYISLLCSRGKLCVRLQLYFTRTTIAVDFKLLKRFTNITIIVDETKFYASKEILAAVSPVFASMFVGNKNEIKLDDVASDEFEELLKIVQPGSRVETSMEMLPRVLKLADRYQMQAIIDICERRFMFFCDGKIPSENFSIACDYGFLRLQYEFIKACSLTQLQKLMDDNKADQKMETLLRMIMLRLLSNRDVPGIESVERCCLPPKIDQKPIDLHTNLTITINGNKLYASKEVLASASPVFAAMLFGNFEDNKKNEIELGEVDADDFKSLLELLVPCSREKVNGENVMGLLKLAYMYLIETVVNMCDAFLAEEYLEKHSIMDSHMYFVVASQYQLHRLQSVFASNCNPTDLCKLFETGEIYSITVDAMKTVLKGIWPSDPPAKKRKGC